MKMMTLGSLFDGIAGFPLSAARHGIKTLWTSDIEPTCEVVTKHWFPDAIQLGDITKINGAAIPPVDIISGGSPCQDLSVAGKRAGLEGARSGLFMEMTRIIKEMRNATNNRYPNYVIWENVPGAFSSSEGEDFRAVIEEFIRCAAPGFSVPRYEGWSDAGAVLGDGFSFAWRTLDAQFWGVPQRRRRIFAVLDLGGQRAPEVLFVEKGLRGHPAESGEKGEGPAGDAERSAGRSGQFVDIYNHNPALCFEPGAMTRDMGNRCWEEVCQTLRAESFDNQPTVCYALDALSSNSMKSDNPNSGFHEESVMKCLDTGGGNPSCNQGGNVVVQPCYVLQGNGIDRADTAGCNGAGWREDVSYTLNTIDRPAVVHPTYWNGEDVAQTLTTRNAGGCQRMPDIGNFNCVIQPSYSMTTGCFSQINKEKTATLAARDYKDAPLACYPEPPSYVLKNREGKPGGGKGPLIGEEQSFTLATGNDQAMFQFNSRDGKRRYFVRRITPTEYERLQGFPDGWTDIPVRKIVHRASKTLNDCPEDDETEQYTTKPMADSARYGMLGNSVAVPCVEYIMGRIAEVEGEGAGLAYP